ncbi:PREDICTED: uncharacterized protein K02A2.6-like [Priapulus caudatus]|uniref:RNA-directed DNA polymerase n=1 Tax=Priapulus caudatus TaxID=37621 RepID=A0ABM1DTF7_PRICU|nr:PREDICTED: uncharacterized protein K02A2.6-like [Priapulus caudatus]
MIQGAEGVICSQDDVWIKGTGKDGAHTEDLELVEKVLQRLTDHGVKAKVSKCQFLEPKVVYLGHVVDKDALHPTNEKVKAIRDAPVPRSVQELKSFIGLVNYYGSFLKNMSTTLAPLNKLRQKDEQWVWSDSCQRAFVECKKQLSSDSVLTHYDVNRKLKLDCDASPNGIQKEALSIVFRVKKFHQYLYGRKWTLVTDHKPLVSILGPKSGIPTLAAARMQRSAIILSTYDYNIDYRKSVEHANADCMSRQPHEDSSVGCDSRVYACEVARELSVTATMIAEATRRGSVHSRVLDYMMSGWPEYLHSEPLKPHHVRRHELSVEQGCILWGNGVIIPGLLRDRLLKDLHWEHPGISTIKAIARSYVWWPSLDREIECTVKEYSTCQAVRNTPPVALLYQWRWPVRPWSRIHLDFFFKEGKTLLIVYDAYSKWIEVCPMSSTDAEHTIDELRVVIAAYGLSEEVVSDNGPQYISETFKDFLRRNGIKQTLVPPYHPQSNGAAENSVKMVKRVLEKHMLEGKVKRLSVKHRLANFLCFLRYRSTPHSTTGRTPAELFLKRQMRTRLSLVKPNLAEVVERKQEQQKRHHDRAPECAFQCHDRVRVRNMLGRKTDKWLPGSVVKVLGPRRYLVQTDKGLRHIHVDHVIPALDQVVGGLSSFVPWMPGENRPEQEHDANLWRLLEVAGKEGFVFNSTKYVIKTRSIKMFETEYGFKHTTSSPGYPQSNGTAEKAVQVDKNILKKCRESKTDPYLAMLLYRNTPGDGFPSPAQILMGRRTATTLPTTRSLLKPENQPDVTESEKDQRKTEAVL